MKYMEQRELKFGVQCIKTFGNMTIIKITIKCFKLFMENTNDCCLNYDMQSGYGKNK